MMVLDVDGACVCGGGERERVWRVQLSSQRSPVGWAGGCGQPWQWDCRRSPVGG